MNNKCDEGSETRDMSAHMNRKREQSEELLSSWLDLKKALRNVLEAKKKLELQMAFNEEEAEWNKNLVNQLKQQVDEYQNGMDAITHQLKAMEQLRGENRELEKKIAESNSKLIAIDECHRQEVLELKKFNQDLNVSIECKEALIDRLKCENSDIKELYEHKISELYREFDVKYDKCMKANDEKIIEIRANCMLSVEKTKQEYENRLARLEFDNHDLNKQLSDLRLQLEAWKCQKGQNTNLKNVGYKSSSKKAAPKHRLREGDNRAKVSMNFGPNLTGLLSDSEDSASIEPSNEHKNEPQPPSASKRKKLAPNGEPYLSYLENEDLDCI